MQSDIHTSPDDFELFVQRISNLGTERLSEILGINRCEILGALGESIVSSTLARAIALQDGSGLLSDTTIRLELLNSIPPSEIADEVDEKSIDVDNLEKYAKFAWGANDATRLYLSLIGLPETLIKDQPQNSNIVLDEVDPKESLYPFQNWMRKKLVGFLLNSGVQRAIVHMPTGSGKTRTTMEALCDAMRARQEKGFTVVWLAHSEELCEQAVQTIQFLWQLKGSETANIVRLWGGRQINDLDENAVNIVVTSFQTAHNMTSAAKNERFSLFSKIRRKCIIMVVDEAHQSIAPTYQSAIELFSNSSTKLVGLTATPGRSSVGQDKQEDILLAKFYRNNKLNIVDNEGNPLKDPIKFLQNEGVLSHIDHKIWGGSELELTPAELRVIEAKVDLPRSVLERVASDHRRTIQIVANTLKIAIEDKLSTILFAPTKENAVDIALILNLRGCRARAVTADTDREDRRNYIEQFKSGEIQVLTNFGVLTTGFDAPNIDAVVIARPTTSVVLYSQMIGRGLRGPKMGGNPNCLIVDVHDNIQNLPSAQEAFSHFDHFYGSNW